MERIRQNKITKQWVIYAPERGRRPHDAGGRKGMRKELPSRVEDCPFCPGNEEMLPPFLMEHPEGGNRWQTRVVFNKYPALKPEGDTKRSEQGIYLSMNIYGRHEVIIEHPLHRWDPPLAVEEDVLRVVETYRMRYRQAMKDPKLLLVIIFRNHGPRAGTSLLHPHSQLVATPVVPDYIRGRDQEAQRYYDELGRCVFCDVLDYEAKERSRVILENPSFLAFVPFAAEVPFETWIVPKRHAASFGAITPAEERDLAAALKDILDRFDRKLGDPDYNYIIKSAARYKADEPHLHWFLQVRPRVVTRAGFEIGSGIRINPSIPEEDAEALNR